VVEELGDGRRRVSVEPADDVFVPCRDCVTSYPVELIAAVLQTKSVAYVCDEIARDEDPSYLQRDLRYSLLAYLPEDAFSETRLLDFGSGSGASSAVLGRMFPRTEIVGIELQSDLIALAERRKAHHQLSNVRFLRSPSPETLPEDLGTFRYIHFGAVYEHLLPSERPLLLAKLWSLLETGGVVFVNCLPHRYYPLEGHTSGLPLINFLPDRMAHAVATRFSQRLSPDATWEELLRDGIRGGTARRVARDLVSEGGKARVLTPARLAVHDHTGLWLACSPRAQFSPAKKAVALTMFRTLSRLTRQPFAPYLSLAFEKVA
jgi:precorrin-6B methylase 2